MADATETPQQPHQLKDHQHQISVQPLQPLAVPVVGLVHCQMRCLHKSQQPQEHLFKDFWPTVQN
jgi:hypothetical protein